MRKDNPFTSLKIMDQIHEKEANEQRIARQKKLDAKEKVKEQERMAMR